MCDVMWCGVVWCGVYVCVGGGMWCACIRGCVHACMHVCTCACVHLSMCMCPSTCMCACTCVHASSKCEKIHVYVSECVCMHVFEGNGDIV